MTTLGSYPSKDRCEEAVRRVYEQQLDPYGMMDNKTKKKVLDLQMQWSAPVDYRCQKI